MITATDGLDLLLALGVPSRPEGPSSVTIDVGGTSLVAQVITRQNPLRTADVRELDRRTDRGGDLALFVVPHLTDSGRLIAANRPDIAVVGVRDGSAILRGRELRPASPDQTKNWMSSPLRRRPWGRFALLRALVRTPVLRSQTALAEECGMTQSAVSQTLATLDSLERGSSGWRSSDPGRHWDLFLADYPGPGGISTRWFGVRPVREQAERVVMHEPGTLLSGDLAADEFAPWRRPRTAIVYAHRGVDLGRNGFATSRRENATLELVVPADQTIWRSATTWAEDAGRREIVDPLIAAWDVRRSGGADAVEAADRIRKRVLERW